MKRVLFITRVVQTYRAPFHERVREILAGCGVDYRLVHGEAEEVHRIKQDTIRLPWASVVSSRFLGQLIWQPLIRQAYAADLVVIGQENKYLLNYLLQIGRRWLFPRVAFWGHGRNFQSRRPGGLAERWKRLWATRVDWWFGYTDETRRHLEALGFPPDRITIFDNTVDTAALRRDAAALSPGDGLAAKDELGIAGGNVAVFVGALYPDKRLEFLIDAADLVRARITDFQLIVIGNGVDRAKLDRLASTRPWLLVAGARYGKDKLTLMSASALFLMPGLVGLALLDAAAIGLPTVTTAYPWHSPEIAYLEDGVNGLIVRDWESSEAYANAVADLLDQPARRRSMAAAALATAERLTIEAMAEKFATGVLAALDA